MGRRTCTLAGKCCWRYMPHSYHHDCKAKHTHKKNLKWDLQGLHCCWGWSRQNHALQTYGHWICPAYQQGLGRTWAPTLLNRAEILHHCPGMGTTFLRFCPLELLFSHRHKGQVKPEAAGAPSPGLRLCLVSKQPEQGCCCAPLLRTPTASGDG